jgi:hypothetical protein
LIDLHTHTTASDGRLSPSALVDRAAAAGVTVLSVTDHDTVGGCAAAGERAASLGIEFVPGIEITSVLDGRDIHILGYFIDVASGELAAFLTSQRRQRIDRVRLMIEKLAAAGIPLDPEAVLRPTAADASRAAGRPWIARALVEAGHAATAGEAFERWLTPGRPTFVPRTGPSPVAVFRQIHEAGGIASIAHPGLVRRDEWLDEFVTCGLDALEAYHSDHDSRTTGHYLALARRWGIAVTGGSDFHADDSHRAGEPGSVALPREDYERLKSHRRSKQ